MAQPTPGGRRTPALASNFAHLLGFGRASAAESAPEDPDAEPAPPEPAPEPREDPAAEDAPPENPPAPNDDEDPDDEMRGSSAAAQARNRERARCAAIFGTAAAGRNPALAAQLAFGTSLPRSQAIATLRAGAAVSGHQGRAPSPALGEAPPAPGRAADIDSSWDRAMAAARGNHRPKK